MEIIKSNAKINNIPKPTKHFGKNLSLAFEFFLILVFRFFFFKIFFFFGNEIFKFGFRKKIFFGNECLHQTFGSLASPRPYLIAANNLKGSYGFVCILCFWLFCNQKTNNLCLVYWQKHLYTKNAFFPLF